MESWMALVGGIALIVVVEMVAFRLYKRYRGNRQDPLARSGAEGAAKAVEAARRHMARSEAELRACLPEARAGDSSDVEVLLQGMAEGASLQAERLAALLDAADVAEEPETGARHPERDALEGLQVAMGRYAQHAAVWAFEVAPESAAQAKAHRCREAAKALRIAGEVSSCHAEVAEAIAAGKEDTAHEVSLCPTCGFMVFGRRPAFCMACGQPGFEMRALRRGILD